MSEYMRLWAAREFGPTYAGEIADIVMKYSKFNGRRKPEMLDANTYSVVDYQVVCVCWVGWLVLVALGGLE